ncbi:hypothetical protein PYW08_009675 [Mythimna loreyi]|uniref:Uncharacterized protein n=1 Tax=Mythimna loreyi TaxID=667449 RepID=A0ACC2Q6Q4_9NEOP|nr:hypothetical protein PYW08_009675 [Mythimna loreyi]
MPLREFSEYTGTRIFCPDGCCIVLIDLVLLLNIFYVSDCARRIKDGAPVSSEKRYTAYIVKAPISEKKYDAWVCGGAIVSSLYIITSAACVDDVEYMYAIAGYKKYVRDEDIENDECTKSKKKKIVYTCIPLKYELQYDKLDKWAYIDIALVKVESPYDFEDQSYKTVCSYIPTTIPVNYDQRFQEGGLDGLVLGWGHTDLWRKPDDNRNYNQEMLRYAPIKIMDKENCKMHYNMFTGMATVIDKYMICTLGKGDLDENGQMDSKVASASVKLNGCQNGLRFFSDNNVSCDDDATRRDILRTNLTLNEAMLESKNKKIFLQTNDSRKSGICQNDHGGPLVTWVGASEVLIGVASVFKVSDDSKCMGPYLFTSTQCNGAFIDCILSDPAIRIGGKRRTLCDSPPIQRGYDIVEKNISWRNHPAGAAENEIKVKEKIKIKNLDSHNETVLAKNLLHPMKEPARNLQQETIAIRPQRPIYHEWNEKT